MSVVTIVTLYCCHTSILTSFVIGFVRFNKILFGRNNFKICSISSFFPDSICVSKSDSSLLLDIAFYFFIHFQFSIEDKSVFYASEYSCRFCNFVLKIKFFTMVSIYYLSIYNHFFFLKMNIVLGN